MIAILINLVEQLEGLVGRDRHELKTKKLFAIKNFQSLATKLT